MNYLDRSTQPSRLVIWLKGTDEIQGPQHRANVTKLMSFLGL